MAEDTTGPVTATQDLIAALTGENTALRRRIEREKRIRRKAEAIAEQGLRELYHQRRELEFLSRITTMANQAGSAREVLAEALTYIAEFTGWPAAHAYIVAGHGHTRRMWPSNIWYRDPDWDLGELQADTAESVFEEGVGLPGMVWESGQPVWIDDLAKSDNFPRADGALRSGLRCAFSVPVVSESQVTASLEFRTHSGAGGLGSAEPDRQGRHTTGPGDRARQRTGPASRRHA